MTSTWEYHVGVRRSFLAPVVLFGVLVLPIVLVGRASGQTKESSSSTAAHESGSRAVSSPSSAVSASAASASVHVPSPGHGGNGTSHGGHGSNPTKPTKPPVGTGHNQNSSQQYVYGPTMVYGVPVPYPADFGNSDDSASSDADDNDPDYQGGPTVFDRRGSGEDSYVPPVEDDRGAQATQAYDSDASDSEPQEPTILIFKDGRRLEVKNYAIVGASFFDLTPGHPRRIALADLDLAATSKENDARGVIFQLPTAIEAN